MSRIGKQPIKIPTGVDVRLQEKNLQVKGPKGELILAVHPQILVTIKPEEISVRPQKETKENRALWGLFRSLIANMVEGVTAGFEKKLEFNGVGFKAQVQGNKLVLEVGFSHPVEIEAPAGITLAVEKNVITISGVDKQMVGQTAAKIRAIKKPEPYKGTGIRYQGEVVRKKAGKKAAAAE
ncbi:MAG: 50S ribosomal protein L6 [Candidatus Portnoybacteria bacterium CG10_big_fil_rev_8_21_14_0_10_44_7]|uniref:Large ribosomal subunit protein uL6 n=1 Tax=Candidatus Portnoybacteria bacterium CG10_big_fil_rev_8_21_14_0_10_44_7 TaxID=1974816 RepID=A0A2M8KIJ3_9BACT|nr:MAG: 50S ribosomal protein L6 [Candidatus Portnoybacteria bacterium CG10_big_fil_rev_8_21_14_0_10_44_7]